MNRARLVLDKKNNKVYLEVTLSDYDLKYFEVSGRATEPEGKLINISVNDFYVELGGEDD